MSGGLPIRKRRRRLLRRQRTTTAVRRRISGHSALGATHSRTLGTPRFPMSVRLTTFHLRGVFTYAEIPDPTVGLLGEHRAVQVLGATWTPPRQVMDRNQHPAPAFDQRSSIGHGQPPSLVARSPESLREPRWRRCSRRFLQRRDELGSPVMAAEPASSHGDGKERASVATPVNSDTRSQRCVLHHFAMWEPLHTGVAGRSGRLCRRETPPQGDCIIPQVWWPAFCYDPDDPYDPFDRTPARAVLRLVVGRFRPIVETRRGKDVS